MRNALEHSVYVTTADPKNILRKKHDFFCSASFVIIFCKRTLFIDNSLDFNKGHLRYGNYFVDSLYFNGVN